MIELEVVNHVDCQVHGTPAERKIVRGLLGFKGVHFHQGQYAMKRKTYTQSMMLKNGVFPSGLLPRLRKSLERQSINYTVNYTQNDLVNLGKLTPNGDGCVSDIILREDQIRMVNSAITTQRGVIQSPTGTGKTILIMHIMARFPQAQTLILVHNKTILSQTLRELRKRDWPDARKLGDGERVLAGKVVVATRQSLVTRGIRNVDGRQMEIPMVREEHQKWLSQVGVVIIDECHLFGDEWGQYATVLRSTDAPVRIGFTATIPKSGTHIAFALEGMLGPLIDQVTMKEGLEKGLLAHPQIELVPIKTNSDIAYLKVYREIYQAGIVNNRARNRLAISKAKAMNAEGKSVIVFVEEIDHGYNLMDLARLMDLPARFVWQETTTQERDDIADEMQNGDTLCVVASKVWREGLNIPTLGGVILCGGGKAQLTTLQHVGRSLRRAESKDKAVIIDFLDPYKYLAEHAIERISIYIEQGWM